MRLDLLALALCAFTLPATAQTQNPCGLGGVTVTLTPENAAIGEPILVTLTNFSGQTIQLPTSCTFGSVHAGPSCAGPAVLSLICLQVITPIAHGQSHSMLWDQTDDFGAQVPPGKYAFMLRYFDGSFSVALSCCPVATVGQITGLSYCTSGGPGLACPCGNDGAAGEGCDNSTGLGSILTGSGDALIGADTVVLSASQCPPNVPGMFFSGPGQLPGDPFGDGLRCVSGPILRLGVVTTSAGGTADTSGTLSIQEGVVSGAVRNYQYWYRDVTGPCNGGFNTSGGFQIQWL